MIATAAFAATILVLAATVMKTTTMPALATLDPTQIPQFTAAPELAAPGPSSSSPVIWHGTTLEEIAKDPALLKQMLSEADSSKPIHPGDGAPASSPGTGSDTPCPDGVECP